MPLLKKDAFNTDRIDAKGYCNVAVVGAGAMGVDHLRGFKFHPKARITFVVDSSLQRAREAAAGFGVPRFSTDYQHVLNDDSIDVVALAIPNYLHAKYALDALKVGKHVLLEKPMSVCANDATTLILEAARNNLLLMVGQSARFSPDVQTAKTLINDGVLGKIYHARTVFMRRSGIPRIGSWFTQNRLSGGGCSIDIGVHALDRCLFLLDDFSVTSVSAQTYSEFGVRGQGNGTWGRSELDAAGGCDVEDMAVAFLRLASGRTVLLEVSWAAHLQEADVNLTQLYGTEGGLVVPPLQLIHNSERGYCSERVYPKQVNGYSTVMAHFIDVLLRKCDPLVKLSESMMIQRIVDAIYRSASVNREVQLDDTRENEPK